MAFIGLLIFAGQGFEANGKVNLTARTAANLVTEQAALTGASLDRILMGALKVMTPLSTATGTTISATEIQVDNAAGTTGTVVWSRAATNYGPSRTAGSTLTIPTGPLPLNSYQIYIEVSYAISPFSIYATQSANLTLRRSIFLEPRNGGSITYTP